MNLRRIYLTLSAGILLLASSTFFSACNFGDLNEDPTKSTDMDPNLLLPTIQMYLTNDFQEWHRHMIYPGGFVQQWCGDWGTVEYGCLGIKNDSYMAELWLRRYTRLSKNLADIVERTEKDQSLTNINAIGRIMRVLVFHQLTDLYGDIPYFDGGYGYYSGTLKPQYDTQEKIYNDFFLQLERAHQQLDPSGDAIPYDHFYDGDIHKWIKFCNSLRLRLAMRLVKVNPQKAKQEAEIAVRNGVMESNEDMCKIAHENQANPSSGPGKGNGVSNRFRADRTYRYTSKLIEYMESTGDPRITIYGGCYLDDKDYTDITAKVYALKGSYSKMARPTARFDWEQNPADIVLQVNGQNVTVAGKYQYLQPSKWFMALDAPYVHMSYAEVEFLLAEAKLRGWDIPQTVSAHYEKALRASVEYLTVYGAPPVDAPVIDRFVSDNQLVSGREMEQINMQLWVGSVLNPFEAFANWRRTNIPEIQFLNYKPASNQSGGMTPRRLLYPVEEQVKNRNNYYEAISRVPGYDWTVGVWWDVSN